MLPIPQEISNAAIMSPGFLLNLCVTTEKRLTKYSPTEKPPRRTVARDSKNSDWLPDDQYREASETEKINAPVCPIR